MPDSRDDDDVLTGPVPRPDDEPTAAERAHAKTFAELVDKTLAGRAPPAMSADDRALLEVATVIRAASGDVELAEPRRRALIEGVLRQAVGAGGPSVALPSAAPSARGRWLPWTVAASCAVAAAAAASALLWLRVPASAAAPLPFAERSRSADAVVGPIARDQAGDAGDRIDAIFADRLDGYRALRFGGTP